MKRNEQSGWLNRKRHERAKRALERQLDYQRSKAAGMAGHEKEFARLNFIRTQQVRQKLEQVRPVAETDKVLEVGSGAHGLIFGLACGFGVGIDPLADHYKRLFPHIQTGGRPVAAMGEDLPFDDAAFDIVLSDNVIDHAEQPLKIVEEMVRVLRPGGLIYFTVNVHHPLYNAASHLHGAWNALGVPLELSAFADHTVHLTEEKIAGVFRTYPLRIVEQSSTVAETRANQRSSRQRNPDALLKKLFYKNALFEILAEKGA